MRKTYKTLMAATLTTMAACALFFTGCNKESPELDTPFVNVDRAVVDAPATGGELALTITANRPWKLSDNMTDEKWLIADKTEGNGDAVITLTVAPNTGVGRETDLRIATSTVYIDVRITQPGDIATEVLYADDFGNGVSASPWPSVTDYAGWNKSGAGADGVTYGAEGSVSIRSTSASSGYAGASGQCNVMMASAGGASFLINGIDPMGLTNMSLSFGSNETGETVKVSYHTGDNNWTDVPYTKTTSDTWDLVAVTFALPEGSTVLNLKFTANQVVGGYGTRIDDVRLVGTGGAPATGDLRLSPGALSFAAGGEQKSFTVTSIAPWTATPSESWLTISPGNGTGNGTVNVTAAANTGAQRTATITVTAGTETKTVSVTQAAAGSSSSAIYYEDMGKTASSGNPVIASWTGWSRDGTGGSSVTYSGTNASVRTSVPSVVVSSSVALYSGASGVNSVFFGAAPAAFTAENIALSGVNNVTLTFGASKVKYTTTNVWDDFAAGDLTLSYSPDGTQWFPATWALTSAPASGSTVTWALATAEIPTTGYTSLSLKWDCTFASQIRIDDIKAVPSSGTPASFLNISPASASFTDAAGAQTVTVAANVAWTVTSDAAATWCTVMPTAGTGDGIFSVTVAANSGATARSANITVSGTGVASKTVAVTQAATGGSGSGNDGTKEHPYTVSEAASNQGTAGNTDYKWVKGFIVGVVESGNTPNFTAPYTANTNLIIAATASETDWNNCVSVQLPNNIVRTDLNLADNASNTGREVLLEGTLEPYFGKPGLKNARAYEWVGAPGSTLGLSPASYTFSDVAGTQTVAVTSNTGWAVTPDDAAATWCAVTPTSGTGDGSLSVTVVANTGAQRTTAITVKTNDNAVTRTFTVTQAAAPATPELAVSPLDLSFAVGGEQKSFAITSNTAWTVVPSESWVSVSSASGNGDATIDVTAAANSGAARSATITVSGTGVTDKTVAITQAGVSGGGSTPFAAIWDFKDITTAWAADNSPCSTPPTITGSVVVEENLTQFGFGKSGTVAGKSWGGTGFNVNTAENAATAGVYATVKVKSTSKSLSLSTLSGNIRKSGTGPTNTAIFYKLGDGAFVAGPDINNGTLTNANGNPISVDLSGITALQNVPAGTVITIKFVPYGTTNAGGTWYLNSGGSPTTALQIEGTEQ